MNKKTNFPTLLPPTRCWIEIRASFQELRVNKHFRQEPVSGSGGIFFFLPIFPLAVTKPHLVIGPLVSSGHTNREENLTQRQLSQRTSDLKWHLHVDERPKRRGKHLFLQNIHISVDKESKIAEIKVQSCKIVVPKWSLWFINLTASASYFPSTSLSHFLSI